MDSKINLVDKTTASSDKIDLNTEILTIFILIFTILSLFKLLFDKIFVRLIIRQISKIVEKYKKINGSFFQMYHKNSNNPNENYEILVDQNLLLFGVAEYMNDFYSEWKSNLDHEKIKKVLEILRIDKLFFIWWNQHLLLRKMRNIKKYLSKNIFDNKYIKLYYMNNRLNLALLLEEDKSITKKDRNLYNFFNSFQNKEISGLEKYLINDPQWLLQICNSPYPEDNNNIFENNDTNGWWRTFKQKRKWKKQWLNNWEIKLIDSDPNSNISYYFKFNTKKQNNNSFKNKLLINTIDNLSNSADFNLFINNLDNKFSNLYLTTNLSNPGTYDKKSIDISFFIDIISTIDNQLDRAFFIDIFKTLFRYFLKIFNYYEVTKRILHKNKTFDEFIDNNVTFKIINSKKDEHKNIDNTFTKWIKDIYNNREDWYNGFNFLTIDDPIWDYSLFFSDIKDTNYEE